MISNSQWIQFRKLIEGIDDHGFGEFTIKWKDNKVIQIYAGQSFKAVDNTNNCFNGASEIVVDRN